MKRSQFLWNILVGLAVVLLLIGGFRLNSMRVQVDEYATEARTTELGTDQRLNRMIAFLESNLEARDAFQFSIPNQPMLLTNVVFLSEELARAHQEKVLRVAAIVGASQSTALVEYGGKYHRLTIGDNIAGGTVIDVRPEEMVMRLHGRRAVFPVLGRTMSAEQAEKYRID